MGIRLVGRKVLQIIVTIIISTRNKISIKGILVSIHLDRSHKVVKIVKYNFELIKLLLIIFYINHGLTKSLSFFFIVYLFKICLNVI